MRGASGSSVVPNSAGDKRKRARSDPPSSTVVSEEEVGVFIGSSDVNERKRVESSADPNKGEIQDDDKLLEEGEIPEAQQMIRAGADLAPSDGTSPVNSGLGIGSPQVANVHASPAMTALPAVMPSPMNPGAPPRNILNAIRNKVKSFAPVEEHAVPA